MLTRLFDMGMAERWPGWRGGRHVVLALVLTIAALVQPARAALIRSDFATAGDNLLITDTVTHLEFLSPYATRGRSINEIMGGHNNLLTTHGFRYAGAATIQGMIDTHFPGTITTNPGTVGGFAVATAFMNFFGQNAFFTCQGLACPRTQGWAIDGVAATPLGMITLGTTGWQTLGSNPVSAVSGINDSQIGHWLIRSEALSVPEPASLALLLFGTGTLAAFRRRRPRHTAMHA